MKYVTWLKSESKNLVPGFRQNSTFYSSLFVGSDCPECPSSFMVLDLLNLVFLFFLQQVEQRSQGHGSASTTWTKTRNLGSTTLKRPSKFWTSCPCQESCLTNSPASFKVYAYYYPSVEILTVISQTIQGNEMLLTPLKLCQDVKIFCICIFPKIMQLLSN